MHVRETTKDSSRDRNPRFACLVTASIPLYASIHEYATQTAWWSYKVESARNVGFVITRYVVRTVD